MEKNSADTFYILLTYRNLTCMHLEEEKPTDRERMNVSLSNAPLSMGQVPWVG